MEQQSAKDRKVLLSVHDVSPAFRAEVENILSTFDDLPKALLVTPLWANRHPLTQDFCSLLKGHELILHGCTHQAYSRDLAGSLMALKGRSDRELHHLNEKQTRQLLHAAVHLFEEVFGYAPKGFVPPTWYHNRYSIDVLCEQAFFFTETATHFIDILSNKKIFSPAICTDYGNNVLLERLALPFYQVLCRAASPALLRISIHPSDVSKGYLPAIRQMISWLQQRNYRFVTYSEVLQSYD